jgi:probable rRNA maturation factor
MNAAPLPFEIEIVHRETSRLPVSDDHLRQAATVTLASENIRSAEISLVLTDDAEIHQINIDFLGHDYPTDVISFLLNDDEVSGDVTQIDGELIISVETAERAAREHGCSPASEVILYVVHGLLHLCGYDDQTDLARLEMRQRELEIMKQIDSSSGAGAAAPAGGNDRSM